MNINILSFIVSLIAALSSQFYLKGLIGSSIFQPSILFFLFMCSFLSIRLNILTINKGDILFASILLGFFFLLNFQLLYTTHHYGYINEFGRVIYPFLVTLVLILTFKKFKLNLSVFISTLAYILLLDVLYRLYINEAIFPFQSRYDTKGGGFLYSDSNFSSYISGALFFLIKGRNHDLKNYKLLRVLFFLESIWGLSLAAYAGFLAVWVREQLKRFKLISPSTLFIITTISVGYASFDLSMILTDGSLLTKIQIVAFLLEHVSNSDFNYFSGIGFGNFRDFTGYAHAAHSIFGIILEGGLFFTALMFILFWFFWRSPDNKTCILFMIVAGFSMFPLAYLCPLYFLLFNNRQRMVGN